MKHFAILLALLTCGLAVAIPGCATFKLPDGSTSQQVTVQNTITGLETALDVARGGWQLYCLANPKIDQVTEDLWTKRIDGLAAELEYYRALAADMGVKMQPEPKPQALTLRQVQ